jgi:hypothetical protein
MRRLTAPVSMMAAHVIDTKARGRSMYEPMPLPGMDQYMGQPGISRLITRWLPLGVTSAARTRAMVVVSVISEAGRERRQFAAVIAAVPVREGRGRAGSLSRVKSRLSIPLRIRTLKLAAPHKSA